MKKINFQKNQNKNMKIVIGSAIVCSGLFMASRFVLPDDTPIMDTWKTSLYSNMGYQVNVSDVTISQETGETFFTLVQNGVPYMGETIKLSLHAINKDGTLSPIQNVSQLTLETDERANLKMTGYSFFAPTNTYHLQVTVTALDSNNKLLNQQVIYLDTRKMEISDKAFTMEEYVEQELEEYLNPPKEETTNKVKNPVATTGDKKNNESEITGDDIQTPNEEVQQPDGTLQQTYIIEGAELIQSDHDGNQSDDLESSEPQYTLEDLKYQLDKMKSELEQDPNNEEIKTKISELETQINNFENK